jgi:carbamoyl-phosphate synthase large subunit
MAIAYSATDLDTFLAESPVLSPERPILVDRFLEDAFEYDVDAVSDGENVYVGGIMQHIEAAGVHSGDSACVFPPFKSDRSVETEMIAATAAIAREIGVQGFSQHPVCRSGGSSLRSRGQSAGEPDRSVSLQSVRC